MAAFPGPDSGADVAHQGDGALRREPALAQQQVAQRFAFDQLHHDVGGRVLVARFAVVVDGDDVWVTQHRGGPRLAAETLDETAVGDELAQQHLDRHLIADVDAAGAIDRAHAAFAPPRADLIFTVEHLPDERIKFGRRFG